MSSHFPHVRIDLQKHGFGSVYIDDVEINGVRKVAFEAAVDDLNTVTLTLIAGVTFNGPANVVVIEDREPMLPQLGKFD